MTRKIKWEPDAPVAPVKKAKRERVSGADVVAVLNAVSKGMPLDSAHKILAMIGCDEATAKKLCEPAAAHYEAKEKPPTPQYHNHVTVPQGPAPVVNVAAPNVTVQGAEAKAPVIHLPEQRIVFPKRPSAIDGVVQRNSQGRIERVRFEFVE